MAGSNCNYSHDVSDREWVLKKKQMERRREKQTNKRANEDKKKKKDSWDIKVELSELGEKDEESERERVLGRIKNTEREIRVHV